MTLPARDFFTTERNQGLLRQGWDAILDSIYTTIGTGPYKVVTLVSGAIPASEANVSMYILDGENALADDLTNIPVDEYPQGSIVLVKIADEARPITLIHNGSPGVGDIVNRIQFGRDLQINRLNQHVIMQLTTTFWSILSMVGDEKERAVGDAGEAQFQNGHVAGTDPPVYWRDANGLIHFDGVVTRAAAHTPVGTLSMFSPLPLGYRPPTQMDQLILRSSSAGSSPDILSISTGGDVRIVNSISGDSTGTNVNVYLSGVVPYKGA